MSSNISQNKDILSRLITAESTLRLSRVEIADKTNYSSGMISEIMNGNRKPTDRFIQLFCTAFNVSENWIKTGEGGMFLNPPPDVTNLAYVQPKPDGADADQNDRIAYEMLKKMHGWDVEEVIKSLTALPRSARMKILAQMFEAIEEEDERKMREEE